MDSRYHPIYTMDSQYQPLNIAGEHSEHFRSESSPPLDSTRTLDKKRPRFSATSLFSSFSKTPDSPRVFTTRSRPRSWLRHYFSHFISVLWLVPITVLLVLNYKNHVIGASVWCPLGKCASDAFDDDAVSRAAKLDKMDHNILGALQFASKGLEVWFMLIATALVYDLAMILARVEGGLPVGYLLTHLEFSDLRNLFNPSLWTSPFPHSHATESQKKRRGITRLLLFAVLAGFLTILTNLMGPATAVLVLPTLQWIQTSQIQQQKYAGLALSSPPAGDNTFPGACNSSDLTAGNYNCTYGVYSSSMDEWVSHTVSTILQNEENFGFELLGISQEAAVQFTVNVTDNDDIFWVPNRQVLRDLSEDYYNALHGTGESQFNNSLATILHREGPSIGLYVGCASANLEVVQVAQNKEIHCYSNLTMFGGNYTKCYRIGEGFGENNTRAQFWLGVDEGPSKNESLTLVDLSFSDRATVFTATEDSGSGIEGCLNNKTAPTCDWDKIFSAEVPPDFQNTSVNVGLLSYSFTKPPIPQARAMCDIVAYETFPTYSLDTTLTNVLGLVQLDDINDKNLNDTLVVDPNWYLAAMSVNQNDTMESSRLFAQYMAWMLPNFYNNSDDDIATAFCMIQAYYVAQAMSMVNYFNHTPSAAETLAAKTDNYPPGSIFRKYANIHVWAYGLGARTSKLGVAVALCGVACVLLRIVLGLLLGKREHSAVELFAAALDHQPTGEFAGMKEETHLAKVRYILEEDDKGKLRFVPERQHGRAVSNGYFAM